ncbi:hypothetical protein J8273_3590 [Carpediemonas membranifera]|uniref:Uncharacterized protein n=1 Tax=Carpediemonas membranifera TaxID=201153 RepID=A0A8J6ASL8_9EUKA|nr:hypothetical protein J8273_3590 [Carpediemonas membranifera]|eukprot:KAG9393451.1 hypothetical protein J8273_3590 [Carpediemonas membranifera]
MDDGGFFQLSEPHPELNAIVYNANVARLACFIGNFRALMIDATTVFRLNPPSEIFTSLLDLLRLLYHLLDQREHGNTPSVFEVRLSSPNVTVALVNGSLTVTPPNIEVERMLRLFEKSSDPARRLIVDQTPPTGMADVGSLDWADADMLIAYLSSQPTLPPAFKASMHPYNANIAVLRATPRAFFFAVDDHAPDSIKDVIDRGNATYSRTLMQLACSSMVTAGSVLQFSAAEPSTLGQQPRHGSLEFCLDDLSRMLNHFLACGALPFVFCMQVTLLGGDMVLVRRDDTTNGRMFTATPEVDEVTQLLSSFESLFTLCTSGDLQYLALNRQGLDLGDLKALLACRATQYSKNKRFVPFSATLANPPAQVKLTRDTAPAVATMDPRVLPVVQHHVAVMEELMAIAAVQDMAAASLVVEIPGATVHELDLVLRMLEGHADAPRSFSMSLAVPAVTVYMNTSKFIEIAPASPIPQPLGTVETVIPQDPTKDSIPQPLHAVQDVVVAHDKFILQRMICSIANTDTASWTRDVIINPPSWIPCGEDELRKAVGNITTLVHRGHFSNVPQSFVISLNERNVAGVTVTMQPAHPPPAVSSPVFVAAPPNEVVQSILGIANGFMANALIDGLGNLLVNADTALVITPDDQTPCGVQELTRVLGQIMKAGVLPPVFLMRLSSLGVTVKSEPGSLGTVRGAALQATFFVADGPNAEVDAVLAHVNSQLLQMIILKVHDLTSNDSLNINLPDAVPVTIADFIPLSNAVAEAGRRVSCTICLSSPRASVTTDSDGFFQCPEADGALRQAIDEANQTMVDQQIRHHALGCDEITAQTNLRIVSVDGTTCDMTAFLAVMYRVFASPTLPTSFYMYLSSLKTAVTLSESNRFTCPKRDLQEMLNRFHQCRSAIVGLNSIAAADVMLMIPGATVHELDLVLRMLEGHADAPRSFSMSLAVPAVTVYMNTSKFIEIAPASPIPQPLGTVETVIAPFNGARLRRVQDQILSSPVEGAVIYLSTPAQVDFTLDQAERILTYIEDSGRHPASLNLVLTDPDVTVRLAHHKFQQEHGFDLRVQAILNRMNLSRSKRLIRALRDVVITSVMTITLVQEPRPEDPAHWYDENDLAAAIGYIMATFGRSGVQPAEVTMVLPSATGRGVKVVLDPEPFISSGQRLFVVTEGEPSNVVNEILQCANHTIFDRSTADVSSLVLSGDVNLQIPTWVSNSAEIIDKIITSVFKHGMPSCFIIRILPGDASISTFTCPFTTNGTTTSTFFRAIDVCPEVQTLVNAANEHLTLQAIGRLFANQVTPQMHINISPPDKTVAVTLSDLKVALKAMGRIRPASLQMQLTSPPADIVMDPVGFFKVSTDDAAVLKVIQDTNVEWMISRATQAINACQPVTIPRVDQTPCGVQELTRVLGQIMKAGVLPPSFEITLDIDVVVELAQVDVRLSDGVATNIPRLKFFVVTDGHEHAMMVQAALDLVNSFILGKMLKDFCQATKTTQHAQLTIQIPGEIPSSIDDLDLISGLLVDMINARCDPDSLVMTLTRPAAVINLDIWGNLTYEVSDPADSEKLEKAVGRGNQAIHNARIRCIPPITANSRIIIRPGLGARCDLEDLATVALYLMGSTAAVPAVFEMRLTHPDVDLRLNGLVTVVPPNAAVERRLKRLNAKLVGAIVSRLNAVTANPPAPGPAK